MKESTYYQFIYKLTDFIFASMLYYERRILESLGLYIRPNKQEINTN